MKRDGNDQHDESSNRSKPPFDHYFMSLVQAQDEQVQRKMKGQERLPATDAWNWISLCFLLIAGVCGIVGKCLNPPNTNQRQSNTDTLTLAGRHHCWPIILLWFLLSPLSCAAGQVG